MYLVITFENLCGNYYRYGSVAICCHSTGDDVKAVHDSTANVVDSDPKPHPSSGHNLNFEVYCVCGLVVEPVHLEGAIAEACLLSVHDGSCR